MERGTRTQHSYSCCASPGPSATIRPRDATTVMGAIHGIEILPTVCPDIAAATAADIAEFVRSLE